MARGGDGLVLRSKTWWLDFTFRGIRHQVRLGKDINKTVARELAAVERAKILRNEAGIGGKKRKDISFERATKFFEDWAKTNVRASSANQYAGHIRVLTRCFGSKRLSEISPFAIERFKSERSDHGVKISINHSLAVLNHIFARAIEDGHFDGNNPVRKVRRLDVEQGPTRFLSEDEEARLLAASPEPFRTIFLVAIYSGLRARAEILTLRWQNIDFTRRQITVESCYSKNGLTQTIPMHSKLLEPLRALFKHRQSELAFVNSKGKPLTEIGRAFAEACGHAHIQGASPHTLRHTFASRLAMAGVNDRTLQSLGRWQQPKMIMRYAHLSEQHLAESIERIGQGKTLQDSLHAKTQVS
jgi:integrase